LAEAHPIAILTWGDNAFAFYWWDAHKKVIIWAQKYGQWLLQADMNIRDSILDIVDLPGADVELSNVMLFDGPTFHRGVELPEKMKELFLDCEWSDYACDHRPIMGNISICYAPRAVSVEREESLSDDETPPSPRRWRRWASLK
jgi:hypothetical protein